MIGQTQLIKKINSYSLMTLPHSILLIGERGSEKQDICEYISSKFELPLYDITEVISEEYINEIYSMPNLGLYVIDGTKITEKEQNTILKFYEEPNSYMYVIITCESKYNILETIQSRSYELIMDRYSTDELAPLCTQSDTAKEFILSIASTPGMVEELNHVNINDLQKLCDAIINSIYRASYQNTLTIANKINFKDEYDKYPLWAFIRVLSLTILKHIAEGKEINSNLYNAVEHFNKTYEPLLDKRRYFENMLTNMWLEARRGY